MPRKAFEQAEMRQMLNDCYYNPTNDLSKNIEWVEGEDLLWAILDHIDMEEFNRICAVVAVQRAKQMGLL